MAATLAGTPSLRRLKSTFRYSRLAPPPRCREVMRPWVLRPPDFVSPSVRDFSGRSRVTSARSLQLEKRRPGLVGLVVDAERVLVGREEGVALLGDDRADDHVPRIHYESSSVLSAVGCRLSPVASFVRYSRAAGVTRRRAAPITSATPTASAGRIETSRRLRNDLAQASSPSRASTTRARPSPKPFRASAAFLVEGSSK